MEWKAVVSRQLRGLRGAYTGRSPCTRYNSHVDPVTASRKHGRKSGGRVPPRFSGGGHNIKCPPPPHVFGVAMNFGRCNVVFALFFLIAFLTFFFFLLDRNVCEWCGLGTPTHFDLRDFRRRWRSGKKCRSPPPPPPPPPHQLFWDLRYLWGWRRGWRRSGKCVCPPHNPLRICAPARKPRPTPRKFTLR